jgi:hypothetical protein
MNQLENADQHGNINSSITVIKTRYPAPAEPYQGVGSLTDFGQAA